MKVKRPMVGKLQHVTVIGAGIIGLSSAFYLNKAGYRVTVVDPAPRGDKTSFGNAASLAVTDCVPASLPGTWKKVPRWLLDPHGPLFIKPTHLLKLAHWLFRFVVSANLDRVRDIAKALNALNARALEAYDPIFSETDYFDHVRHRGAVVAYDNKENFLADSLEWKLRADLGVQFQELSNEELHKALPELSKNKSFGVLMPKWSNIDDPKELMSRLLANLISKDVKFVECRAEAISNISGDAVDVQLASGESIVSDKVVVAAGAWSGDLAKTIGDDALLESERGYNTTLPAPGIELNHTIVLAEEKFVISQLGHGIRVGGAAEFAGLKSAPNYARSDALLKLAKRILPNLKTRDGDKWMGHRPSTPDSLPVLSVSPRNNRIFYAFGHGHLGLTQGAISGKLISELVSGDVPSVDPAPYSIKRFN